MADSLFVMKADSDLKNFLQGLNRISTKTNQFCYELDFVSHYEKIF